MLLENDEKVKKKHLRTNRKILATKKVLLITESR